MCISIYTNICKEFSFELFKRIVNELCSLGCNIQHLFNKTFQYGKLEILFIFEQFSYQTLNINFNFLLASKENKDENVHRFAAREELLERERSDMLAKWERERQKAWHEKHDIKSLIQKAWHKEPSLR